jgi:hypothetical protein
VFCGKIYFEVSVECWVEMNVLADSVLIFTILGLCYMDSGRSVWHEYLDIRYVFVHKLLMTSSSNGTFFHHKNRVEGYVLSSRPKLSIFPFLGTN